MDTPTSTPAPHLSAAVMRASWRRWLHVSAPRAGPAWLQLAWTALLAAALALGFTLLAFATTAHTMAQWQSWYAWSGTYRNNLIVTLVIAFTTHGLFALARRARGPARIAALQGWHRYAFFIGTPLLGVLIGWPLGGMLLNGDPRVLLSFTAADILSMTVMSALVCGLLSTWFALRHHQLVAEMRANDARLQLLQGQMEPHFLFNTLANVISLIDADAPRAKQMLEAFTEYLRASLGSMRACNSTLAAELELATRYLHVMQTRMGQRLRFEFDVAPGLDAAPLPPLLLQPLVENAVKHGLEPLVNGGTVRVRIERLAGDGPASLRICVEDDGAGLDAGGQRARPRAPGRADGAGIALANLRERLRALYGDAAVLRLGPGASGTGALACLVVPQPRA